MNKKRVIWLVPVLVMAFAMSACGGDDGGRDSLSLSDNVYQDSGGTLTQYTGDSKTFTSNAGGSGLIADGKMTFELGIPNSSLLQPIESFVRDSSSKLDGGLDFMHRADFTGDTKIIILDFSSITLNRIYKSETVKQTVLYIYVDRDCVIKASGIPPVNSGGVTVNVSNFTLDLKRGWNTVTRMSMVTTTGSTLLIGDSTSGDLKNCKWVLE